MRTIQWKEYKFEGLNYFISDSGLVKSGFSGKLITQNTNADGYKIVTLGKTFRTTKSVHRLVAETFIPNPNNLPEVNHIDLNRQNNNVDNLEWVTHQQNIQHSVKLGSYNSQRYQGKLNPNYHNTTLRDKYSSNPELSRLKNSRPREKNGRCVAVRLHNNITNEYFDFKFIGECAEFLIKHNYTHSNKVNCVRDRISQCCKYDKILYKIFTVKYINKN